MLKSMWPFMGKHALPLLALTLLLALTATVAVIAARPNAVDPLDPPAAEPTPAPADWVTPGRAFRHQAVAPVSQNKVPATRITLPGPQQPEMAKATSDGGCLVVRTEPAAQAGDDSPQAASPLVRLRAIRYRSDGSVLWDRTDEADLFTGYPVSICVFNDDSFAVGLHMAKSSGPPADALDGLRVRLQRHAADGTRQWQIDLGRETISSLERLFAFPDGSLVAAGIHDAGQAGGSEAGQAAGAARNRVQLLKLSGDGAILQQVGLTAPTEGSAGGTALEAGHQMLTDADASEGAGMIVAWRMALAEQAPTGRVERQVDFLTRLDAGLAEQWSVRLADDVRLGSVQALADRNGALVLGTGRPGSGSAEGQPAVSMVFHYTLDGRIAWQYAADEPDAWLLAAARMVDGQYVIGQYRVEDDGSERTTLLAFSDRPHDRRLLSRIPGRIEQLVASPGGGFIAVLRQRVRALPQPPVISMLWADTEAIVCGYSRRLQLNWRRTIDQYKHVLRSDLVVVTKQDRLLIG